MEEIITLVRCDVPVHYQWKPQDGSILVDPWTSPSPAAACFDSYQFQCTYDYGTYKQAGGKYNNGAKDRVILGCTNAVSLSEQYLWHPLKRLFDLPTPGGKNAKLRCFVREHVGGELTEVSKKVLADLVDDEAGDVIDKKNPSGNMKLLTLHSSPLLGLRLTNLATFFNGIDDQSMPVDTPNPPEAIAPPLVQAGPDIAASRVYHG
jgi:hypothetical protein